MRSVMVLLGTILVCIFILVCGLAVAELVQYGLIRR